MMDVKRVVVRIFRPTWMGKLGQKFGALKLACFIYFLLPCHLAKLYCIMEINSMEPFTN